MPDEVPLPSRLLDRPQQRGLVVPYISVQTSAGDAILGNVHRARALECIDQKRCQICGQRLTMPVVVLVRESQLHLRYSDEPALHPECARYSVAACPMLNGRMSHYAGGSTRHLGKACDKPGCDCGGWVNSPGTSSKAGEPAEPWVAVWLRDYALAVDEQHRLHGLTWLGDPIRIRPVPRRETSDAR